MRTMQTSLALSVFLAMTMSSSRSYAADAVSHEQVHRIKVLADKAPDCSTLKSIIESVTRGCKTNDEKAIAIYNFMQLSHYHQGYPGEKGGLGALKEINVYGWSLCGGLHTVEAALWREAGWPWRFVGWSNPGHTTVEVQYDGRWHYLDVFLKFYSWVPDANSPGGRTIAGQDDIKADSKIITDGLELDRARSVYYHKGDKFENINEKANWLAPAFLNCGDEPEGIITGIKSSSRAGSPTGWAGLEFDTPNYSTDVNLAPGYSLSLTWDTIKGAHWWNGRQYVPGHGCGDKDYRNCPVIGPINEPYNKTGQPRRSFATGTLVFAADFADPAFLNSLAVKENVKLEAGKLVPAASGKPASITISLQSPYVMSRASGVAAGADSAELSLDGGKTFKSIKLNDFSEEVGGNYGCLVKLSFKTALTSLRLEGVVQCNRGALPYLSPGKNTITVSVADAKELGDNQLVVTYAYELGSRSKSYEQLADAGAELARAHFANWSTTPTVAQKVFAAKDLPATFEIDVPTPKGKYPVYPRMLFLRREVVAAGAKPLPLPEKAELAKACPAAELKTLPNPFLIGTTPPPAKVERPTTKRTISLRVSHAVSKDGQALENHYLKTKEGEHWVILVGGDLKDLPSAKDIAMARLVFPVAQGHARAATKVGVSPLSAPFQDGKPYDFKTLGDIASSTVVPKQPSDAAYSPPKSFAIDVTRLVKQLAAGETKFNGLALQVIQDRSVDDGYITRVDMPKAAEIKLELDVYDR